MKDTQRNKELRKLIGEMIKCHRKLLRMNQTEYAKYLGVGRFSTISSYELGQREAPYRIIYYVMAHLLPTDVPGDFHERLLPLIKKPIL